MVLLVRYAILRSECLNMLVFFTHVSERGLSVLGCW